jgi:hypothetical protein
MRAGLLALALLLLVAAPASAQENPIFQPPGIPPAGANNPACKPAAAHPCPVILVHGTFGDMTVSWNSLAPALQSRGFCVWALDYGAGDFRLRTGATRIVRVRLSRAGTRSLERRDRLAVRARALLPRPGGGVAVSARRYTLR